MSDGPQPTLAVPEMDPEIFKKISEKLGLDQIEGFDPRMLVDPTMVEDPIIRQIIIDHQDKFFEAAEKIKEGLAKPQQEQSVLAKRTVDHSTPPPAQTSDNPPAQAKECIDDPVHARPLTPLLEEIGMFDENSLQEFFDAIHNLLDIAFTPIFGKGKTLDDRWKETELKMDYYFGPEEPCIHAPDEDRVVNGEWKTSGNCNDEVVAEDTAPLQPEASQQEINENGLTPAKKGDHRSDPKMRTRDILNDASEKLKNDWRGAAPPKEPKADLAPKPEEAKPDLSSAPAIGT